MTRWTKDDLTAHLSELHPHGQVTIPREYLLRETMKELRDRHLKLHGYSSWGREEHPHGPQEASGHD